MVQSRRNAVAAKKFFRRLLKGLRYVPRVIVTDKLASYQVAHRELMPWVRHRRSNCLLIHTELECVGTADAMTQAIHSTRPGGFVGFVGVPHDISIGGGELFRSQVGLRGGPAPVRRFLPDLIADVLNGKIKPGKVFDRTLPLEQVADGYRAMDQRQAIKVLLTP
jgi:Zn-dependent alcohol dehydrogenase